MARGTLHWQNMVPRLSYEQLKLTATNGESVCSCGRTGRAEAEGPEFSQP